MYRIFAFLVHPTIFGYAFHTGSRLASNGMATLKTHLDLNDKLLTEAMRRGGHETKRATVNAALAEYINSCKRLELLALRGKVRWEGNLDQMRKSRVP